MPRPLRSCTTSLPNTSRRPAPLCWRAGASPGMTISNAPRVAIVNREFARRMLRLRTEGAGQVFQNAGWNAHPGGGDCGRRKIYEPDRRRRRWRCFSPSCKRRSSETWLVVRSNRDPQATWRQPSRTHTAGPGSQGCPPSSQTWDQELDVALFPSRMATVSLGVLGVMGAMLSITGIFGMAAYSVSKRLRELGIRIALGAQREEVSARQPWDGPSNCWSLARRQDWFSDCLRRRVLAFIVYQARRAIRWYWPAWSSRCCCWVCWQPGFQRSARSRSIR